MLQPETIFKFNIETLESQPTHAKWRVPEDLPYLNGHFPNQPVVPGVAQIEASLELVRTATAQPQLALLNIKQAKFMSPLLPNDEVEIEAKLVRDNEWTVDWKKSDGQYVVRLVLVMKNPGET